MTIPTPQPPKRASYLPISALFQLRNAVQLYTAAFGEKAYLVGSALHHKHYRDVDVRMMLEYSRWHQLFPVTAGDGTDCGRDHPLLLVLNHAISEHLSRIVGLPIDFQLQRVDLANAEHEGRRHPLLDPKRLWIDA